MSRWFAEFSLSLLWKRALGLAFSFVAVRVFVSSCGLVRSATTISQHLTWLPSLRDECRQVRRRLLAVASGLFTRWVDLFDGNRLLDERRKLNSA